jgi:hypothetical protein
MHAVLVTAALILGSGDGRGGATDERTMRVPSVEEIEQLLEKGPSRQEIRRLMGVPPYEMHDESKERYWIGPPWRGTVFTIFYSAGGRVEHYQTSIIVRSLEEPCSK